MNLPIYSHHIKPFISEFMSDTPVILLAGPRQSGKTTLVKEIANQYSLKYLTMDDESTLLSAKTDPVGIINNLDKAVIDEIQRVPQLLLAIKKSIDEDRRPGRFLITGSSNLMMLPTVADSLTDRMETLSLFPLSQGELESHSVNWIDSIFSGQIPSAQSSLLDLTIEEIQKDRTRFGNILETFVFSELVKHKSYAEGDYQIMYYRDADKVEVDFVIESTVGNIIGIEVKAAASIKESDFKGLKKLSSLSKGQFKMGLLLYNGSEAMPLGNNIWAAPISSLWGT